MEFIAVDGEGTTDKNGIHRYVMLSIGEVTLMSNDGMNHICHGCPNRIEENMISVDGNYYHPRCYYRLGPFDAATRIAMA